MAFSSNVSPCSSGGCTWRGSERTSKSGAASWNSRSFPGLEVAQETVTGLGMSLKLFLHRYQLADALPRQHQQRGHLFIVEGRFFGSGLDFDEPPRPGHHHVHIDLGLRVFLITEIQHRRPPDDSHTGGSYEIPDRRFL